MDWAAAGSAAAGSAAAGSAAAGSAVDLVADSAEVAVVTVLSRCSQRY